MQTYAPFQCIISIFSIFGRVVSSTDLAGEPRSEWLFSPESQGIPLAQSVGNPQAAVDTPKKMMFDCNKQTKQSQQ